MTHFIFRYTKRKKLCQPPVIIKFSRKGIVFSTVQKQPPRQFSKISVLFSRSNLFIIFQEGPFVRRTDMNFPGGSICSSNRHEFSRRVRLIFEQTQIFQESLSKIHVFSRRFYLFVRLYKKTRNLFFICIFFNAND